MPASVEAQVANVALLRIGQLQSLSSLTDPTPQARAVAALWAIARDATLQAYAWPFATFRSKLAAITGAERTGWAFAYGLPIGFIAARYLYPGTNNPGEGQEVPFTLEGDDTAGQVLLTNLENAELIYTGLVDKPARWSPMFKDALAMKLAADLALSVAKKPSLAIALMNAFRMMLPAAAASSFNQSKSDVPPESELVRARE